MGIAADIIAESEQRVPDTMSGIFDVLAENSVIPTGLAAVMKKAVGFRNVAIHNYQAIDWAIVYGICNEQSRDFQTFAKSIAA